MGGHRAGEVASAMAIAQMTNLGSAVSPTSEDVVVALTLANAMIMEAASDDPAKFGMGTTLTGIALVGAGPASEILVFNLGDSRVYRMHTGELAQVTTDHSMVDELVRAGRITREEASVSLSKHVVTRALGMDPTISPDLWSFPAVIGDRYLVCSDGLTNEVDAASIARMLAGESRHPQDVVDELLQATLDHGARDNVSMVLVEVVGVSPDAPVVDDDTNPRLRALAAATAEGSAEPPDERGTLITGIPSLGALRRRTSEGSATTDDAGSDT
jgi:protein phosphatase